MTQRIDAPRLAMFGAALIGADAMFKAERRYVQDVRRDMLRNVDRGVHRTRRRMQRTATGFEVALITLVVLASIASEIHRRQRPLPPADLTPPSLVHSFPDPMSTHIA